MNKIKTAKVTSCKFTSEWVNPMSRKIIYYHEVTTDAGDLASCGTIEKDSHRIAVGARIEYEINDNGRMILHSSSNDKKAEDEPKDSKTDNKKSRIKGQEAFLGYAWSYAKDLIIAGKTSKDLKAMKDKEIHPFPKLPIDSNPGRLHQLAKTRLPNQFDPTMALHLSNLALLGKLRLNDRN
jgi:hypothetical protein